MCNIRTAIEDCVENEDEDDEFELFSNHVEEPVIDEVLPEDKSENNQPEKCKLLKIGAQPVKNINTNTSTDEIKSLLLKITQAQEKSYTFIQDIL